ncbi:MAG: DNA translocase FtsK 4TM domain-containing protein [Desulfofustis sp.]|nr:DNA translocase FtsK 4TM domain-containing protein [Desulfofustis sp.]MBT8353446.1 DNA translocase FtsK 4TM domain-containing protein [Desulfofustis sp.]NNK56448.1 cell division protein FtsK [Desulfofustis sp.]
MAQSEKKHSPGFRQEIVAVLGLFISAFVLISLISAQMSPASNWCGEVGRLVSQILLGFIGWGAYLLVGLLAWISFLFFNPRMSFERLPQVTLGISGAIISCCALLSSVSLRSPDLLESGGFLGKTVFTLIYSLLGSTGTVLILVLVLIVSLMLSTQFSPYQLIGLIWRSLKGLARGIFGVLGFAVQKVKNRPKKAPKVKKERSAPLVKTEIEPEKSEPVVQPVVKEFPKPEEPEDERKTFHAAPLAKGNWKLPPLSLLARNKQITEKVDKNVYLKISKQLEQKLKNFGVSGKVVGISPGPVVTTYEYSPAPGIKINKIVGLADDLALGLKAQSVRVIGSVPGKSALGIEIPNEVRQVVYIRDLLGSERFKNNRAKLAIVLGLDVVGTPTIADLSRMPHLLMAGATGAGKSVAINSIIASILFNATPEDVRFLMIDPKRIELSGYEGIPHLLHPVVVEPKLASRALIWAVREMERRYRMLEEARVKGFDSYNEVAEEKLPYIVIIVDELADLMMVASKDVEGAIARLAQMARAAGIHLILATQRPSVDVLTGLIKANFPTRISFKVSSKVDSRTIIDGSGAEHLLGMGDMLYMPPGTSTIKRVHGAYISEQETAELVTFLKKQGEAIYDDSVLEQVEEEGQLAGEGGEDDYDDRYDEAVAFVCDAGQASISMIQRRLRIGYNRAARIIEMMEKEGIVGPADGAKPREVLARKSYE